MTLYTKLNLPIMDCKSYLVALRCDSHWGILSIRSLSFSGGNIATSTSESSSMPRKVMVVVGPVSLLRFISTGRPADGLCSSPVSWMHGKWSCEVRQRRNCRGSVEHD